MRIFLALIIGTLSFSFSAQAEMRLAAPRQLVAKAQMNKTACREVVLDILANLPEIRDPQTFDSYFNILDDLQAAAQKVNLDSIYPDAIKTLGSRMTASGVRWLSIVRDDSAKIINYHRWMVFETAYAFQSTVDSDAKGISDEAQLRKLAENVVSLEVFLRTRFPDNRDLRWNYLRVLSELAARRMILPNMTEEGMLFWINKISVASGYALALEALSNQGLAITKENKAEIHRIARRIMALSSRMQQTPTEVPPSVESQLNDSITILLVRTLDYSERFELDEFSALVSLYSPRGLQEIAIQWSSLDHLPKAEFTEHYLQLAQILLQRMRDAHLEKEALDFGLFQMRLAAPLLAKARNIEGTYSLKDAKGKSWFFTIALSRPSQLILGLGDAEGFVQKSYFVVTYQPEIDSFIATQRESDFDPGTNMAVQFKVATDGSITVRDFMAVPEAQVLTGKRTESYTDFFARSRPLASNASGTYRGNVSFGRDHNKPMTLIVTAMNGYTVGRLFDDQRTVFLELNVGSQGTDGVLYLTTGRPVNRAWAQLRGYLEGEEFRGEVIVGGRGNTRTQFRMRKVSN